MLLIFGIALLASYQALFPLPANIVFERFFALASFFLLCVVLMMGPLAAINPQIFGFLLEPRRTVGILAAIFFLIHIAFSFLFYLGLQFSQIISQIAYILAAPALLIFTLMALTSTNWAIAKIGYKNWKNLHRLGYIAFALIFAHFLLKATGLGIKINNGTFINLAEVSMIALGLLTIAVQVCGFFFQLGKKTVAPKPAAQNMGAPPAIPTK